MHELSVTENIIKICSEEAEKHNVNRVKQIKLKVGKLSGLVPESIKYYFDIASKGTRVEGAELNIQNIPIVIKCGKCSFEGEIGDKKFYCPNCRSYNIKIIRGNEFLIDSLEVE